MPGGAGQASLEKKRSGGLECLDRCEVGRIGSVVDRCKLAKKALGRGEYRIDLENEWVECKLVQLERVMAQDDRPGATFFVERVLGEDVLEGDELCVELLANVYADLINILLKAVEQRVERVCCLCNGIFKRAHGRGYC